jgi:hypothetical protein
MLVLPRTTTMPRVPSCGPRSWRRTAAASLRGSSIRRWDGSPAAWSPRPSPRRAHAGQRPQRLAGRARARRPARRRPARPRVDVQERVHPLVDGGDPVEVGAGRPRRRTVSPRRSGRPSSAAVILVDVVTAHASSSRIRGTRNRPSATSGAPAAPPPGQARLDDVVAEHVGQRHRVRGRAGCRRGDLADPATACRITSSWPANMSSSSSVTARRDSARDARPRRGRWRP